MLRQMKVARTKVYSGTIISSNLMLKKKDRNSGEAQNLSLSL